MKEEAFEVLERSKGAPLIQLLAQGDVQSSDPEVQARLDVYRSACGKLAELRKAQAEAISKGEPADAIEERILELSHKAKDSWDFVKTRDPRIASIIDVKGISSAQLQKEVLQDQQIAVEYLVVPGSGMVLEPEPVKRPDQLLIFVLPWKGELSVIRVELPDEAAAHFDQWLLSAITDLYSQESQVSAVERLSSVLLEPIEQLLPAGAHLLICPDRNLFALPFEVLQRSSGEMLLESNPVSYMTSTTALTYIKPGLLGEKRPNLFAGITFGAADEWLASQVAQASYVPDPKDLQDATFLSTRLDSLRQLYKHPLYGVMESARSIAPLLDTDPMLDEHASEEAIRESMPGKSVIHLATHGILSSSPLLNGIVTYIPPEAPGQAVNAQSPDDNVTTDGLLQMGEIMGLELAGTELTVLQCCHGAQGELSPGTGVMGLTQAFFYAGSRRVLASLKEVPDDSTAVLLLSFYEGWLQDGKSPTEALRYAKMRFISEHPSARIGQWAPFVIYGVE